MIQGILNGLFVEKTDELEDCRFINERFMDGWLMTMPMYLVSTGCWSSTSG